MKKIAILIIVLVVLGVGFYAYNKKEAKAPSQTESQTQNSSQQSQEQTSQTTQNTATTTAANSTATSTSASSSTPSKQFSSGSGSSDTSNNIQVVEVDFDGTQFTPNTVTIHQNDWVFFKNKSTEDFWVASNPHPTHTDYPGFDAKQSIAPGGEYKFQFTKIGSWGYHDHLDHTIGGTVVVTQ